MKNHFKYYIVMILVSLSVISVGFASWFVAKDFDISTSGSIYVDDVLKGGDYIECTDFTAFKYFKTGFVNSQNKLVRTGTLNAKLTVKIDNCKKKFKQGNDLDIVLTLTRSNLSKFNNRTDMTLTPTVSIQNGNVIASNTTNPGTEFYDSMFTEFTISNYINYDGNIIVLVTYEFKMVEPNGRNYFIDTIFPELINHQSTEFVISARITSK